MSLPDAPVAFALAQVQFPELSSMTGSDVVDAVASRLSRKYPIKRDEPSLPGLVISDQGISTHGSPGLVRVLISGDEQWQLRVASTSLTLTTLSYAGRRDFIQRFVEAWTVFADLANPPFTDRLGVRYANVVQDAAVLDRLPRLVRTEVLGPRGVELGDATFDYSLDDTLFRCGPDDLLQVRTGVVPPGTLLDPVFGPMERRAWVLDLDASQGRRHETSADAIGAAAEVLAARAYRYFRWAVRPEFLVAFGGR